MDYFSKYNARMRIRGTSTASSQEDQISAGMRRDWANSPSARKVLVTNPEGANRAVRIQTAKKTVGMDKIYVHPDDDMNSGDVIQTLQNFSWLVLDTKLIGHIYKQANIVRINRNLKWMVKGKLYEQSVRVKNFSRVDGVDEYYFFTTPENTVNVFLPMSEKTATIKRDQRLMIDGLPYQVTRLDQFTYTGVVVLYIVEDIKGQSDTEEIADFETEAEVENNTEIQGPGEIPYGFSEQYALSLNGILKLASWRVEEEQPWFKIEENDSGVEITVAKGTENIGKSISLIAEYENNIYAKLILVRSLV